MSDWRQKLCGSIPLRAALEGGQAELDMQSLRQISERMSCGGMYIPGWQQRFFETMPLPKEKRIELIHLAGKGEEVLMLAHASFEKAQPSDCNVLTPIDQAQASTDLMLRELDLLWNKHQN